MKLEEYEEICPLCNGRGYIEDFSSGHITGWMCGLCMEDGKIDWVDKIKYPNYFEYFRSKIINQKKGN